MLKPMSGVIIRSQEVRTAKRWQKRAPVRFAIEFSLLGVLLAVYLGLRFAMKGDIPHGVDNARRVVRIERAAGFFSEGSLQKAALHSERIIRFLNTYYLTAHFTIMVAFLVGMFIWRPEGYRTCRRVLVAMTAIGLLIHAVYPLAPPRMLTEFGFIDTGRLFGPSPYTSTSKGLANQFAAMPSLHFGWALLVGWGVIVHTKTKWRYLAALHPFFTLAAIIITANHYWSDAFVALVIFTTALSIDRRVSRRRAARARAARPADDLITALDEPAVMMDRAS